MIFMDCEHCGETNFEGVVCPQCEKDLVVEAHLKYNTWRAKDEIERGADETTNWHEIEKNYLRKPELQTCNRCGWEFIPTRVKRDDIGKILEILLPKTCPNPACNSPYWDKPRQIKGSEST